MGNHPSSGLRGNNGPFRRPTGSLGLTKSELDERCKPSGLYQSCSWDDRVIRRMIGDGKLAARLVGKDERRSGIEQECPICFLQYDEINILNCCKATICTECYLQVQDSRHLNSSCPFCNKPQMSVVVGKRLGADDVAKREEEEQKVIEATIRARANSESISTVKSSSSTCGEHFGARLNEEMKRTRSRTMSDHDSSGINPGSVTMTPNERRELENQMRSQLSHPLMREMQRNAEVESQRHLLEHAERRRDRILSSREQLERLIERARVREHGLDLFAGSRSHDYDDDDIIVPPDDIDDESSTPNFDDFYLLEAALYLSAREDSMRRRGNSRRPGRRNRSDHTLLRALLGGEGGGVRNSGNNNNNDGNNTIDNGENDDNNNERNQLTTSDVLLAGLSEANQLEMAIQMSLREAEEREQQQQEQDNQGDENEAENAVEETTIVDTPIEEVDNVRDALEPEGTNSTQGEGNTNAEERAEDPRSS